MSGTYTLSNTNTYTEARARYVMGKVYEDITSLMLTDLVTLERSQLMRTQLLYLLDKQALKFFEFQFVRSGVKIGGVRYAVKADNTIVLDNDSGNINFWTLYNTGVHVILYLDLNESSTHIQEVNKQLNAWGCGDGNSLAGTEQPHNSYSKDGYGVKQSIIGTW
jgi:hypothetical protein